MIPFGAAFTATSIGGASYSIMLGVNGDALTGFILASVNAGAAVLTGYGTYRMSKEKRKRDAKMDEMDDSYWGDS